MGSLLTELQQGWLSADEFARVVVRLVAAMIVGAVAGLNRELGGKAAGLRTHMLVAMGAAAFIVGADVAGISGEGMSRVIQGLAAGIGFIGGGAILKSVRSREIHGLTTAASIWMTAAMGMVAGLGHYGVALVASLLTLIILWVLARFEARLGTQGSNRA